MFLPYWRGVDAFSVNFSYVTVSLSCCVVSILFDFMFLVNGIFVACDLCCMM